VLQITLPFIRDAKRLIDVFRSLGYPNSKINLIVNRYEKGGEISLDDAGRTLGVPVFKTVPNSYASVAASINHGIPILRLAPRDPVAKALQEMAQALASGNKQASGWLRALLSRTT
jgi:pilus assembly protein CpaE